MNRFIYKVQIILFFLVVLFVMSSAGQATTYYVDATNGNDSNSGTSESSPWKTIAKVNKSYFKPGDFVLFKRGKTWREQLTVPSSGSTGNPITFGAYGIGNSPVISGANLDNTGTGWTGPDVNGEYYKTYMTQPRIIRADGSVLTKGTVGLLNANEWGYNDTKLYLKNNPTSYTTLEIGQRSEVFTIADKSYITVDGLELRQDNGTWGGALFINNSSYVTVQNCLIHDVNYAGIFMYSSGSGCNNNLIDSNNVHGNYRANYDYGSVVKLGNCNSNTIKNNTIYHSNNTTWSVVLQVYDSDSNIIENNNIYGPAGNLLYIRPNSDSNIVRYNKLHDSQGGMGIQIREGSDNNLIYYNRIYNMDGGPAIQSDGDIPINGTKIYNNTIYNTGNNKNGISIHHTNTNCEVKNNLVYVGESSFALHIHESSSSNTISNHNLLKNISGTLVQWNGNTYHVYEFPDYQKASGQDLQSKTDDPKFVNPENGDFSIRPDSPCIDSGVNVGLSKDFRGNDIPDGDDVDIGAYEYNTIPDSPKNLRIIQ